MIYKHVNRSRVLGAQLELLDVYVTAIMLGDSVGQVQAGRGRAQEKSTKSAVRFLAEKMAGHGRDAQMGFAFVA